MNHRHEANRCNLVLAAAVCAILAGCSMPMPQAPVAEKEPAEPVEPAVKVVTPSFAPWQDATGRKGLLMHYMPWYVAPDTRGFWGSHWTGHDRSHKPDNVLSNGLPDIWSHYHPLIGLYDSTDPAAIECHLLQMKLAGIDGVIADWYGTAPHYDHPEIHTASRKLFDATAALGMKFAVCYEDRSIQLLVDTGKIPATEATNELANVIRWMDREWFGKPNYYRLQDKPLLLNFGPMYMKDAATWDAALDGLGHPPVFFALHHLWRATGADGGFSWVHTEPWESTEPATIRRRVGEVFTYFTANPSEAIVSAYPGFDDVYPGSQHVQLDHRNGDVLRMTLDVGMAGPWPLIQLVTWNDYGEGTMIEPTHEFGYAFLEIIQESRRRELGDLFTPSADDLRLPARLYALRKSRQAPAEALDEIATLLSSSRCKEAAEKLAALDGH